MASSLATGDPPGSIRRVSYTRKCGDWWGYPSNFHDCYPISGRQHENTVGEGSGGVPCASRWETGDFGLLQSVTIEV